MDEPLLEELLDEPLLDDPELPPLEPEPLPEPPLDPELLLDPDALPPLEDGDAASPPSRLGLELPEQPTERPTATTNAVRRKGDRCVFAVVAMVVGSPQASQQSAGRLAASTAFRFPLACARSSASARRRSPSRDALRGARGRRHGVRMNHATSRRRSAQATHAQKQAVTRQPPTIL